MVWSTRGHVLAQADSDYENPVFSSSRSEEGPLRGAVACTNIDADGDGVTSCGGDCNDADPGWNPGAGEICDGYDNDCNGLIDDGIACTAAGTVVVACPTGEIREIDTLDGTLVTSFDSFNSPISVFVDAERNLFVGDQMLGDDYAILRVDWFTHAVTARANTGAIGLYGLQYGPQGSYFASSSSPFAAARVAEFDAATGQFIRELVSGVHRPAPGGFTFGPNGHAFVAQTGRVSEYELLSGDFVGVFATDGLDLPNGLVFAPNGNLLIADTLNGLREYDGTTGALVRVISSGAYIGVAFGPGGRLYASETRSSQLHMFDWPSGVFQMAVELPNCAPHGIAYRARCTDCDRDGFDETVDCNDFDSTVYPGAVALCDGLNNDCDSSNWPSLLGTEEIDNDGDNFTACSGDCDDTNATVFPEAPQLCDGLNNDCAHPSWPVIPSFERDNDGDSFFNCQGDCNDFDPTIYLDALEICDGKDNDCNALIDDDEFGEDTDFDTVNNVCDNCPQDFNTDQDDVDDDRVGDACDNCPVTRNPSQTDIDQDLEGDVCDQNDGVILVRFNEVGFVEWQVEGFTEWNLYRGDIDILRSTGTYSQIFGTNSLANRFCDLDVPWVADNGQGLSPGDVAFFLATGNINGMETDLGTDGQGNPRPNTNSCDSSVTGSAPPPGDPMVPAYRHDIE